MTDQSFETFEKGFRDAFERNERDCRSRRTKTRGCHGSSGGTPASRSQSSASTASRLCTRGASWEGGVPQDYYCKKCGYKGYVYLEEQRGDEGEPSKGEEPPSERRRA